MAILVDCIISSNKVSKQLSIQKETNQKKVTMNTYSVTIRAIKTTCQNGAAQKEDDRQVEQEISATFLTQC